MKMTLTGISVDDQATALAFYTEVLGVVFRTELAEMVPVTVAVLENTCGDFIQLHPV